MVVEAFGQYSDEIGDLFALQRRVLPDPVQGIVIFGNAHGVVGIGRDLVQAALEVDDRLLEFFPRAERAFGRPGRADEIVAFMNMLENGELAVAVKGLAQVGAGGLCLAGPSRALGAVGAVFGLVEHQGRIGSAAAHGAIVGVKVAVGFVLHFVLEHFLHGIKGALVGQGPHRIDGGALAGLGDKNLAANRRAKAARVWVGEDNLVILLDVVLVVGGGRRRVDVGLGSQAAQRVLCPVAKKRRVVRLAGFGSAGGRVGCLGEGIEVGAAALNPLARVFETPIGGGQASLYRGLERGAVAQVAARGLGMLQAGGGRRLALDDVAAGGLARRGGHGPGQGPLDRPIAHRPLEGQHLLRAEQVRWGGGQVFDGRLGARGRRLLAITDTGVGAILRQAARRRSRFGHGRTLTQGEPRLCRIIQALGVGNNSPNDRCAQQTFTTKARRHEGPRGKGEECGGVGVSYLYAGKAPKRDKQGQK